ncbi:hypothetical protein LEP1GSC125_2245 [Leptospira mayottensis 200901122]|uniref:Uncharacterized protein n=1 Tax=Leptospira mayottensis 200901122 TaxID=1193010 RepID=A0AA87SW38_9LEPT|nr:hypothetical protein [Leptospira mayottensis]EKR98682.1 hypothetical protein LEP1GSC125_2245 [Leptospira mayottensis 200901122]
MGLKFRKYFLSKEKISEAANVFIYDYSKDVLKTFKINDLNFMACLSIYENSEPPPYDKSDFMIGFEVDEQLLSSSFVFIGKESPFVQGQLQRIVWQKIKSKYFPSNMEGKYFKDSEYSKGDSYKYETGDLQYFAQDLVKDNRVFARRLLVMDRRTKNKVYEAVYSGSLAPFDHQWTGRLFKNKPKVIFGFEYISFGCDSITFLESSEEAIHIDCDNRH